MRFNWFTPKEGEEYRKKKRYELWKKYMGKAKLVEKGEPYMFLGEKKNGSPNIYAGHTREDFEKWIAERKKLWRNPFDE